MTVSSWGSSLCRPATPGSPSSGRPLSSTLACCACLLSGSSTVGASQLAGAAPVAAALALLAASTASRLDPMSRTLAPCLTPA